ncbi:MAG: leucine--tRNA ligase [Candidatus Aenigmatarchaeota archaeon]|nr:MAG: leucine--tRNA ligase [Candidatus Aenigmarchaeota archaeon]
MFKNFKRIERKWQKRWEKARIFEANPSKKPKFFITFPIPYLNGSMHIGAAFTALRCDSYARFKRMQGFNVLFPQGFHATGEPILGAIERLKKGDKIQAETFKLYGASERDLNNFKKYGAAYVAKFWAKKFIQDMKRAGFSIDWRRTFITALDEHFNRFIEWQYNLLRKKGYVKKGTHPVIYCPHCKSPTGDHDRLIGEGESPLEYIILKFPLETGEILPCATLRPETIYGVTNIWVNPSVDYVKAWVDDEVWILSKEAAFKLKEQLKKVLIVEEVSGYELVGKIAENPVLKNKVIVLPASFCDPKVATGIVMSVPAHAPWDYIALKELQASEEEIKKYGLEPERIKEIKPVSMIKTKEFGEIPAKEICEKLKIKTQAEKEKLDQATEILYKKEFHLGILKQNCGKYAGFKVSEVKEKLIKEFLKEKIADLIYEPSGKVVCRCGTENYVKILKKQWFLKYSDKRWKELAKKCLKQIKIYPEEARAQFEATIDWLKDKACARKAGLGTQLPWDKEWKVETLSDSTIYMAFYTIARIIKKEKIAASKLTNEVFDFIFLGKGNVKKIAKQVGLKPKVLEEMRKEFEYFYPVDLRNSAKELVPNHLTFYIFHHVAIWPRKYWPRAIGVNGFVNVYGAKMSKSKGNVIPLRNLVEKYGADVVRINIVASSEGLNDADWRDESIQAYASRINFLFELVKQLKKAKRKEIKAIDVYLQSKLQALIKEATQNYEELKFRSAAKNALFDSVRELKWYVERNNGMENCNRKVLKESLEVIAKLLAPLVPHACEELWEKLKKKGFIAKAKWPEFDREKFNKKVLELEEILRNSIEDIRHVIKLAGKKKNCYLYTSTKKEFEYLNEAKEFLRRILGFENIFVFRASDKKRYDPQNKASKAKYGKPGIYLE